MLIVVGLLMLSIELGVRLCVCSGGVSTLGVRAFLSRFRQTMKGFLTAFAFQEITGDHLFGLFRTDRFCSMMTGSMSLTTVVKKLTRILDVLFLPGQSLTVLELLSFIKDSCMLTVVQECDTDLMVEYLIQILVQFEMTPLDTRRRLSVFNCPFLRLMKEIYQSETRTLDGTLRTLMVC